MLKARAVAATALLLLACTGSARALLIEEPGENPPPGTTWPADVPRRVRGYWLNGNTFQYYVGSAKAFNDFLRARAATATVMLILHPGPGDKGMAGAMDLSVRYNWSDIELN
jgi:hypothetical protein